MAMATVDYLKEYRGLLRNIAGCSVVMPVAGNAIVHPITVHPITVHPITVHPITVHPINSSPYNSSPYNSSPYNSSPYDSSRRSRGGIEV